MGRALVLGDASWDSLGGRRQLVSFERGAWLRGEGGWRWRALWWGRKVNHLSVCARPVALGGVGREYGSVGGSRTMGKRGRRGGCLRQRVLQQRQLAHCQRCLSGWVTILLGLLNPKGAGWMWLCRCREGGRLGVSSQGVRWRL